MKHFNFVKVLSIIVLFGIGGSASGQINPLAFGPHGLAGGTTMSDPMYYINYVGARLMVTAPSLIAGEKLYTTSNDGGGGTGVWGGAITTPIVNADVIMWAADSLGCSITPGTAMAGKVALIWRGNCEFGAKALQAQNAGAVAIIIINQYAGAGPVGMGAGASGASVTIPVFMVGNLDGIAMSGQYGSAATGTPGTVKVSITPWGQGLGNDLGFVPNGVAAWHNYATPAAQFMAGAATANAYKGIDVAFIANYGTNDATNVRVISSTSFTPTGGAATEQHRDTTDYAGPFVSNLALPGDDTRDSILAMITDEYNLTATGPGRFDVSYTISSDFVEDFAADNTKTSSFYLTDSVYSKGLYDFAAQKPIRNIGYTFGTGTPFVWGPFYYVAQGGSYFSKVQYSISASGTGTGILLSDKSDALIFKWEDGANGQPVDSILQGGELLLKAWGEYSYLAAGDTSGADFSISTVTNPDGSDLLNFELEANSWYYVGIGVASSTGQTQFLGCDGVTNPLVRVYGRGKINPRNMEYQNQVLGSADDTATAGNFAPMPGTQTSFVNNIDSFNFPNIKGMVPSVALITRTTTVSPGPGPGPGIGVNEIGKPKANVTLFPNPASDYLDVAVEFDKPVKNVTYRILDGLGRFVAQETVSNVTKETHRINTSSLKSGFYYLLISADGARVAKQFTIKK